MSSTEGWHSSHVDGFSKQSSMLEKPFYDAFALAALFPAQSFEIANTSLGSSLFEPLMNPQVNPIPRQTNQQYTVSYDVLNVLPVLEHAHVGVHTRINGKGLQEGHTEYFGLGWRTFSYNFMTPNEAGILEIEIGYRLMSSLFLYSGSGVNLIKTFRIKKGSLRPQSEQQHFTEFISF